MLCAAKAGALPVAVPGVLLGDGAAASHTDRGHALGSLDTATGGGRLVSQLRYTWMHVLAVLYTKETKKAIRKLRFPAVDEIFSKSRRLLDYSS